MTSTNQSDRAQSPTVLIGFVALIILTAVGVGVYVFIFQPGDAATEEPQMPVATSTPAPIATASPTPTMSSTRTQTRTPTQTPTTTPTPTPTATPTPWPTVTTAPEPYEEFKNAMLFALEEESAVPVRFRGMRVVDDDLVFVVNYTTKSTATISRKKQRSEIFVGYAWAIYWHDTDAISGKIPTGLQILEVDNTDTAPKYAYVSTDNTRKWLNDNMTNQEYKELVVLSIRNQTAEERNLVDSIDREWENRTYHNESVPLYPE